LLAKLNHTGSIVPMSVKLSDQNVSTLAIAVTAILSVLFVLASGV
jgi:hypothetical protein